jgi:heptosyltransferase II
LDAQDLEVLMDCQKILVIQTAFLGDAILTLPMIQELYKNFNNPSIDVIAIPSTAEIFEASPYIEKVIVYDKHKSQRSLSNLLDFVGKIRKSNYDCIYSPHRSFRTSLIVFLSGIKKTYGFDKSSASFVYKNKIKYNPSIHEVARNLSLIGFDIKNDGWKILPEVKIDNNIERKVDSCLENLKGRKIIAIAPGSVWQTKRYPAEYFEKIILNLNKKNYFVALIGSKEDSELCSELCRTNSQMIESFAGRLSIVESIELIKSSSLMICNDSAPTHMAMAANIPALTIYCSTIPDFGFYPYNSKSESISFSGLKCKPCGIHGHRECPIKTFDCGLKLLPEQIIEKAEKILA